MCYCWFVDGIIVREDNQIIVGCTPQENATDGQDFYCLGYLWNIHVRDCMQWCHLADAQDGGAREGPREERALCVPCVPPQTQRTPMDS